MSSLKTDVKMSERGKLNTTIDYEVFEAFKRKCKTYGIPMNILIETFMRQFANDEFYLKLGKNIRVDLSDE